MSKPILLQKLQERIGEVYHHVTIIGCEYQSYQDKKGRIYKRLMLKYRCECGSEHLVRHTKLPKSCHKCYLEIYSKNCHIKHGMCDTPEYKTWENIKKRCYNPNADNYKYYGGRQDPGPIIVCDRWLESFENFLADMGPKPEPKENYSIDRIDNNGNYEPGNCKWSSKLEQARNKRIKNATYIKYCNMCGIKYLAFSLIKGPFCSDKCIKNAYKIKKLLEQDLQLGDLPQEYTLYLQQTLSDPPYTE